MQVWVDMTLTRMNLAVTGTREGWTDAQRETFERILRTVKIGTFRHGSCKGVDVQAAEWVRFFQPSARIVYHPGPDGNDCRVDSGVDDEVLPGSTHFARNRCMVEQSDGLIAFPLTVQPLDFGGTWYTICHAVKRDKPLWIVWPDGSRFLLIEDARGTCIKTRVRGTICSLETDAAWSGYSPRPL